MTPKKPTIQDIGTSEYHEWLRQEAAYWERVNHGEVDISLAAWRDPELSTLITGDFLERAQELAIANGPRILELACGTGHTSIQLAQKGCHATGVDIAIELLRQGQDLIRVQNPAQPWPGKAQLFVGDLNRLGLAPNAFDVVLALAALHHTMDLEDLTDRIFEALKPGGLLICVDHMEASVWGILLRYACLFFLPTEIPYWRKPLHLFNRLGARVFRRVLPQRSAPKAFTLPESSPFEDITGSEAIEHIRRRFQVEEYQTYLIFADIVAGHLRLGSHAREIQVARWLRRADDWLVRHLGLRGQFYFLVARKPKSPSTA